MIWLAGYVLSIVGANWLLVTFGVVPIGLGLAAPAGVFAAGLTFSLRDAVRERLGYWWALEGLLVVYRTGDHRRGAAAADRVDKARRKLRAAEAAAGGQR